MNKNVDAVLRRATTSIFEDARIMLANELLELEIINGTKLFAPVSLVLKGNVGMNNESSYYFLFQKNPKLPGSLVWASLSMDLDGSQRCISSMQRMDVI